MTTKDLYSSIGVSGYEHQQCWRKDGVFHQRMSAPASCYRCPQCGNLEVVRRGDGRPSGPCPTDRHGRDSVVHQGTSAGMSALLTSADPSSHPMSH